MQYEFFLRALCGSYCPWNFDDVFVLLIFVLLALGDFLCDLSGFCGGVATKCLAKYLGSVATVAEDSFDAQATTFFMDPWEGGWVELNCTTAWPGVLDRVFRE